MSEHLLVLLQAGCLKSCCHVESESHVLPQVLILAGSSPIDLILFASKRLRLVRIVELLAVFVWDKVSTAFHCTRPGVHHTCSRLRDTRLEHRHWCLGSSLVFRHCGADEQDQFGG